MHHLRSDAERNSLLLLYWLGACDVRDQFPIWPWPHFHPSMGLPGHDRALKMPGLLEIAREAGIDHGVYVGTNIPYVATVDLVSTWCSDGENFHFVFHANKPYEMVMTADPLDRIKERLELTRRYANIARIPQHVVHAEHYPPRLFVNLDVLRPLLTRARQQQLRALRDYGLVVERCSRWAYQQPLNVVLNETARYTSVCAAELQILSQLALWHQDVDHDLRGPLEPWSTLIPGGRALKEQLHPVWSGVKK